MSEDNLKLWSCYPNENNIEHFESLPSMPSYNEGTEHFFQEDGEHFFQQDEPEANEAEEGEGEVDGYEVEQDAYGYEGFEEPDMEGEGGDYEGEPDDMEGEGGYEMEGEEDYGMENFEDEGESEGEGGSEEEYEGEGGATEDGDDASTPGYENFTETSESEKNMELWTCYPSNKVENFQNTGFLADLKAQLFGTGSNADLYMWIAIVVIIALVYYYMSQEKK
jgi:hypothetical protein